MKWILKRALLAVPAVVFYSLFSFHVSLIAGCSSDSSGRGGDPKKLATGSPTLTIGMYSTDTTERGGGPKLMIQTSGQVPAGSQIVLECLKPDCTLLTVNGSTDTTGTGGGPKRIFVGMVPVTIPDGTEMVLKIIPGGDPATTGTPK